MSQIIPSPNLSNRIGVFDDEQLSTENSSVFAPHHETHVHANPRVVHVIRMPYSEDDEDKITHHPGYLNSAPLPEIPIRRANLLQDDLSVTQPVKLRHQNSDDPLHKIRPSQIQLQNSWGSMEPLKQSSTLTALSSNTDQPKRYQHPDIILVYNNREDDNLTLRCCRMFEDILQSEGFSLKFMRSKDNDHHTFIAVTSEFIQLGVVAESMNLNMALQHCEEFDKFMAFTEGVSCFLENISLITISKLG